MELTSTDFGYLSFCVEGFFFGIYSGLFAIYLLHRVVSNNNAKPNLIFYTLCVLYLLSLALIIGVSVNYRLTLFNAVLFGCCDFLAQSILILRCWIVWGRNIGVVIIPSILAFAYLVMWMVDSFASYSHGQGDQTVWENHLLLAGLATTMTVNALATGLLVFKILKVFRQVKRATTSDQRAVGISGEIRLRSLIFVIIESGVALFLIQLARVLCTISPLTVLFNADGPFQFIVSVHEMLNGITPTIILVRVSMGLSFHDQESLVEAVGSLQFAPDSIRGTDSIDHDECLQIQGYDDSTSMLEIINVTGERDEIGGSDVARG